MVTQKQIKRHSGEMMYKNGTYVKYEYMVITARKCRVPSHIANHAARDWKCWATESINPKEVKLFFRRLLNQ